MHRSLTPLRQLSIPIYEITGLEKKMTAFVIPNAIQITTRQAKYTFASFLTRDTAHDVIVNIWRLARPEDSLGLADSRNASTRDMASIVTSISEGSGKEGPVPRANKVTHCACSKDGSHLSELALETVLPGTPDKIYNLMFASGFIKDFMKVDQKLAGMHFGVIYLPDSNLLVQMSKLRIGHLSAKGPSFSNATCRTSSRSTTASVPDRLNARFTMKLCIATLRTMW
jgi:hypothetical protein